MPEPRRSNWAKLLVNLLRLLVVGSIFTYLGRLIAISLPQLQTANLRPDLLTVTTATLLCSLHLVATALLWHLLTVQLASALPIRDSIAVWFYSLLGKYVPGKLFVWAGRAYQYQRRDRSLRTMSFAFVLEMGLQLTAALIIILLAGLFTPLPALQHYRPLLLVVLLAGLSLLHPVVMQAVINLGLRWLGRSPITLSLTAGQLAGLLLGHLTNCLLLGLALFLFLVSLAPLAWSHFLPITAAFLLAGWAGILTLVAPGGLGVREGIFFIALQPLLGAPLAAVTVIALRLWTLVAEILTTSLVLVAGGRRRLAGEAER